MKSILLGLIVISVSGCFQENESKTELVSTETVSRQQNFTPTDAPDIRSRNLIRDSNFMSGFNFRRTSNPQESKDAGTIAGKIPAGMVGSSSFRQDPTWFISEWFSNHLLNPRGRVIDGRFSWRNRAKGIDYDPRSKSLNFRINTINDYDGRLRKRDEKWVHLLANQRISHPRNRDEQSASIRDMKSLKLKLSTRLLRDRHIRPKGWDSRIHAQQFVIYFTVQNLNRSSPGFGQYIWIGASIYDSRHTYAPGNIMMDKGTNALIYNLRMRDLSSTPMNSRRWIHIDHDILPHIRRGLRHAFNEDILISKNMKDYHIGGMNLGYETTGLHVTNIEIKNLQLMEYTEDKRLDQYRRAALTCPQVEGTTVNIINSFFKAEPRKPHWRDLRWADRNTNRLSRQARSFSNDDKEQHCYVGYQIAKQRNNRTAVYAGFFKEAQDVGDCDPSTHFEISDKLATIIGARIASRGDSLRACRTVNTRLERQMERFLRERYRADRAYYNVLIRRCNNENQRERNRRLDRICRSAGL